MIKKTLGLLIFLLFSLTAVTVANPSVIKFSGLFQVEDTYINGSKNDVTVEFFDSSDTDLATPLFTQIFLASEDPIYFDYGKGEIEISGFDPLLFSEHDLVMRISVAGSTTVVPFATSAYSLNSVIADRASNVDWTYSTFPNLRDLPGSLNATQIPNGFITTDMVDYIDASQVTGSLRANTLTVSDGSFIVKNNKVGINTASPQYALHVSGNIYVDALLFPNGTFLDSAPARSIYTEETTENIQISADTNNNGDGEIQFYIAESQKMVLTNDGNLGIGITDPSTTLEVQGTISANYFVGDGSLITRILTNAIGVGAITSDHIEDDSLENIDISETAAIDFNKLAITAEDIASFGFVTNNITYTDATFLTFLSSYNYMTADSNLSEFSDPAAVRSNLGLGTLATLSSINSNHITDASITSAHISLTAQIPFSALDIETEDFVGLGFTTENITIGEEDVDVLVANNGYILAENNLSDLGSISTAKSNLSLGNLAFVDSVSTSHFEPNSVTTEKLMPKVVTSEKIALAQIDRAHFIDASITSYNVLDNTLTSDDFSDGSYSKITGLSNLTSIMSDGTITANKVTLTSYATANVYYGDGSLLTDLVGVTIDDDTIQTHHLLDSAVLSSKIKTGTLTNGNFANDADINASKVSGLGTLALLDVLSGGVIEDNSISNSHISSSAAISMTKFDGFGLLASKNYVTSSSITDGTIQDIDLEEGSYDSITLLSNLSNAHVSGVASVNILHATAIYSNGTPLGNLVTSNTLSINDIPGLGALALLNDITAAHIVPGSIINEDISESAGISLTKFNGFGKLATQNIITSTLITDFTILDEDISLSAQLNPAKFDGLGVLSTHNSISSDLISDDTITNDDFEPGTYSSITHLDSLTSVSVNGRITANMIIATDITADYFYGDGSGLTGIETGSLGDEAITTEKLANNSVTAIKIATESITNAHISNSAAISPSKFIGLGILATRNIITSSLIDDNTITSDDVSRNAITDSELADDAVDTTAIIDDAVTTEKVLNGTILDEDISIAAAIPYTKLSGLGHLATLNTITGTDVVDESIVGDDISAATLTNDTLAVGSYSSFDTLDSVVSLNLSGTLTSNIVRATQLYLDGVKLGRFATVNSVEVADISGLGALAALDTINNDSWAGTELSILNGGTGTTTSANVRSAFGAIYTSGDTITGTLNINADLDIGSSKFKVDSTTGHVGIGTSSPEYLLDIAMTTDDYIRLRSGSTTEAGFTFNSSGSNWSVGSNSGNRFAFIADSQHFVEIDDSNGHMGIGVTNPQNRLDVSGNMAIGLSYAGTDTAPDNGLLVEGFVGIGTFAPSYELDVSGTTNASYFIGDGSGLTNIAFDGILGTVNIVNGGTEAQTTADARSNFGAVYINGDTMTGTLHIPSNGLAVGTTELVVSDNKVGISVLSPVNTLDINGNMAIGSSYAAAETAPNNGLIVESRVGIGITNPSYTLDVSGTLNATDMIVSHRLGINESDPDEKLHITGDASSGFLGIKFENTSTSTFTKIGYHNLDPSVYFYKDTDKVLELGTAKNNIFYDTQWLDGSETIMARLDVATGQAHFNGNIGVGGTQSPSYALNISGNGYISDDAQVLNGIVVGSTYAGTETPTDNGLLVQGKVGVGTTQPKSKLDITGQAAVGTDYAGVVTAPTNGLIVQGLAGFGTATPNSPLHVASTYTDNSPLPGLHLGLESGTGMATVEFQSTKGGYIDFGRGDDANDYDGRLIYQLENNTFDFYTGENTVVSDLKIKEDKAIINSTLNPLNRLDVSGNMAIGSGYAGSENAPANSLIVEGFMGIASTNPNVALDVAGTINAVSFAGEGSQLTNINPSQFTGLLSVPFGGTGLTTTSAVQAAFNILPITGGTMTGTLIVPTLGIGVTSTPGYSLEVSVGASPNIHIRSTGTNPNVGIMMDTLNKDWTFGRGANGDFYISEDTDFLTASKARLFIDESTSKVGLGTTVPKSKLDISGGVAIGANYAGTELAPTDGLIVEGKLGIGTTQPVYNVDVASSTTSQIQVGSAGASKESSVIFKDTGDTWAMGFQGDLSSVFSIQNNSTLTSASPFNLASSKLGIGTTAPAKRVHIEDSDAEILLDSVYGYGKFSVASNELQFLVNNNSTTAIPMNITAAGTEINDTIIVKTTSGGLTKATIDNTTGDTYFKNSINVGNSAGSAKLNVNPDLKVSNVITDSDYNITTELIIGADPGRSEKVQVVGDVRINGDMYIGGSIYNTGGLSNNLVPVGTIVSFYGSSIPSGWELADGSCTGITCPDLRYRMIVGANSATTSGVNDGVAVTTRDNATNPLSVSVATGGAHTHSISGSINERGGDQARWFLNTTASTLSSGGHTHGHTLSQYYYQLAYIIKIP